MHKETIQSKLSIPDYMNEEQDIYTLEFQLKNTIQLSHNLFSLSHEIHLLPKMTMWHNDYQIVKLLVATNKQLPMNAILILD